MVKLSERCFSSFMTGLAMDRASVCNSSRIAINDWRLLCPRPSLDHDVVFLLCPTKLQFGSTVARQEINFDLDVVPELVCVMKNCA